MEDLSKIPTEVLIARLNALVAEERRRLPELLSHLGEVDDRKALQEKGYASTFDYCVRHLNYSEDEAYRRIHVARKARKYPEIFSYLRDGRHSLSTLSRVVPSLTDENRAELLERSADKPLREVERIVAPLVQARMSASIRPIRREEPTAGPLFEALGAAPTVVERDQFSFEAPRELIELLDRSRNILWHKYPFGQPEAIFLEWGREWVKRHHELDRAAPKVPEEPTLNGDRPPGWARHAVWKRDAGRCAYVSADGRRCEARRGLELDHVVPRSLGGSHDPTNLRLLCRAHNDAERRRVLGEGAGAGRS